MEVPGVTLLGIAEMDEDHLAFARIMEQLHRLHESGVPRDQIAPVLQALADHARQHFAREEDWMIRDRYPRSWYHGEQHQTLLGVIDAIVREYTSSHIQLDDKLLSDLWEWVNDHIRTADAEYAEFLQTRT